MSILKQAQDYLAGTGGMSTADVARAFVELAAAAQAVVEEDASYELLEITQEAVRRKLGPLRDTIYKLAAVLEEL